MPYVAEVVNRSLKADRTDFTQLLSSVPQISYDGLQQVEPAVWPNKTSGLFQCFGLVGSETPSTTSEAAGIWPCLSRKC